MKQRCNKFFSIAVIGVLLSALLMNANALGLQSNLLSLTGPTVQSQEEAIQLQLQDYFDAKYKMYENLTFDSNIKAFFIAPDNIEITIMETEIEHRKMQITDLKYANYTFELGYVDIAVSGNHAQLSVTEESVLNFAACPDVNSEEGYLHEITMQKVNGKWLIETDEYDGDFQQVFQRYENNTRTRSAVTPQEIKAQILAESRGEVEKLEAEQATREEEAQSGVKEDAVAAYIGGQSATRAASGDYCLYLYNREAALSYAYQYYMNLNPNYVNIEAYGGNCTNFTSQCLKAGGIPRDAIGNYQWYYNNANSREPSWTDAQKFKEYYKNNVGSSTVYGLIAGQSDFQHLSLSDLVQFVNAEGAYHTVIATGNLCYSWGFDDPWWNKYDVLITQNSTSVDGRKRDFPLSAKPGTKEYIQIMGYFA